VNNRLSASKLIRKYDNLIILKSLSKIPGLPGLRVAFAFAQKKIIRELDTVRLAIELPEYNIRKATKILKNPKKYRKKV
jgi:histidinol-phosphate/aromatic aminotransferase/cobyric acid decarboxylase-like protein